MSRIRYTPEQLIGKEYGRLVIRETWTEDRPGGRRRVCKCECKCGAILPAVLLGNLGRNHTTSCGCSKKEKAAKLHRTHGYSHEPLYGVWSGMLTRCRNARHDDYKDYGGRGIAVCREWEHDYTAFKAWAEANGYAPGLQIDRRRNNEGYSPENCRFVTAKVNSRNRRITYRLTLHGLTLSVGEWAERTGIKRNTIRMRKFYGWSDEQALMTPVRCR